MSTWKTCPAVLGVRGRRPAAVLRVLHLRVRPATGRTDAGTLPELYEEYVGLVPGAGDGCYPTNAASHPLTVPLPLPRARNPGRPGVLQEAPSTNFGFQAGSPTPLDRTQPGLPMKPGRRGTMTHDYKRHGTTTLFAALNVRLVAQPRRELVQQADAATPSPQRILQRAGTGGGHQGLPDPPQCRTEAVRVEHYRRCHHREGQQV